MREPNRTKSQFSKSSNNQQKSLQSVVEYAPGFEEDDGLRSEYIRKLTLQQLWPNKGSISARKLTDKKSAIPRTLVRFWHDDRNVPDDVRRCLDSWNTLRDEGFAFRLFGDASATDYIADRYGSRELAAFKSCWHPAMRSDYLRLCYILADGGLYVDADDFLLRDGWKRVFNDDRLKIQPLCYDVKANGMVATPELRRPDLPTDERIFYVNNNPIAASPGHPVLERALTRATNRLLAGDPAPEIQSTTGPGNLTAALAAYARNTHTPDFELLFDWEDTAEPRWDLAYRNDSRNWRNIDWDHSAGMDRNFGESQ
ncbi:hypothetical protein CH300_18700 [Rhodococcus sp. 15-1154-1]|nr:glycosyltransferase [Rhodococcus sp. 15-1154-1]OZF01001.1 hypothetical protein CH300_18700 [Rhodococcus sp. 15-1154-1]